MTLNPASRSSNVSDSQLFEPFIDSLSEEAFDDPVIDPHGCTFNRSFITQ